eukprot:364493-Chlamydomonas_euryale.AAC.19
MASSDLVKLVADHNVVKVEHGLRIAGAALVGAPGAELAFDLRHRVRLRVRACQRLPQCSRVLTAAAPHSGEVTVFLGRGAVRMRTAGR